MHLDSGVDIEVPHTASDANYYGFVLDVEVIKLSDTMIPSFIIAFDVLRIDPQSALLMKGRKSRSRENHSSTWVLPPVSIEERHCLIRSILQNVPMKGVVTKPIYPAADAVSVWGGIQNFPYPIDGLIFLKQEASSVIYKWKPPRCKIKIYIALHKEKEGHRFVPYIYHKYFTKKYPFHDPFYRFPTTTGQGIDIPTPTIRYRHAGESIEIPTTTVRYRQSNQRNTTSKFTPSHCPRECTSNELQNPNQLVKIPSEYVCWASYQIAEVNLDICSGALIFERLRRDKKCPHDLNEIYERIQLHIAPVELTHIVDKINPPTQQSLMQKSKKRLVCNQKLRRLPNSLRIFQRQRSKKTSNCKQDAHLTRCNYHQNDCKIIVWLLNTFSGKNLIDASCSAMKNYAAWTEANIHEVWAYDTCAEKDKAYKLDYPCVDILNIDLSEIQQSTTSQELGGKVDSVFCNFSLHHFWHSVDISRLFLDKISSLLNPGGLVTVTFLRSDRMPNKPPIRLFDNTGTLEFRILRQSDGMTADIYVKSCGHHKETILDLDEVKQRFYESCFSLVAIYSFDQLASVIYPMTDGLSSNEKEFSAMYCAAVFQKTEQQQAVAGQDGELIQGLVTELEEDMLSYLALEDMVSARRISKLWRQRIDSVERDYSKENAAWMSSHDKNIYVFVQTLSFTSIGCFLRFGGKLELASESDDDNGSESSDDSSGSVHFIVTQTFNIDTNEPSSRMMTS